MENFESATLQLNEKQSHKQRVNSKQHVIRERSTLTGVPIFAYTFALQANRSRYSRWMSMGGERGGSNLRTSQWNVCPAAHNYRGGWGAPIQRPYCQQHSHATQKELGGVATLWYPRRWTQKKGKLGLDLPHSWGNGKGPRSMGRKYTKKGPLRSHSTIAFMRLYS